MATDKLAQFVTSGEFLKRANAAITEAVRELEAKGIKPAYVVRPAEAEKAEKTKGTRGCP